MAIVFGDSKLVRWGICARKPILPAGFRYVENESDWLFAKHDDGREFFVGFDDRIVNFTPRKIATRLDVMRTFGKLKRGKAFLDTRSRSAFPAIYDREASKK